MIVFPVSLNFDSAKEILKIRCNIYILMKKVIILRKVRVIMKTFAPTFFDYFSLCLSKKKICDNEAVVCSQSFLRSSRSHIFFKKGVLKNFANLTGKHVCIKNRLQDRCFPMKFAKFLRTSFLTEYRQWLLLKLNIYMLQLWIY